MMKRRAIMKKNEISVKKSLEVEALAAVLNELAASLRAGTVCVEREGQFVTLIPAEVVDLELEAVRKKNKSKLSLELTWRDVVAHDELEAAFTISSQEPEPVAEEAPAEEKEESYATEGE
jgi:amphi-Trp domain-containing protein